MPISWSSPRFPLQAIRICVAILLATPVWAQSVISARSGIVHYVEGDVAIDGEAAQPKFAQFPEVKKGQVLSTTEGRAEMLLTPGVFLRLSENSSVKMVSNSLSDTRVEVMAGTALIEVGELLPDNAITILTGEAKIALPKRGLYRVDAEPARLRVFDGQAQITDADQKLSAKKGREVELTSSLPVKNFDVKEIDAFHRWSGRRTGYIAAANVTSAHVAGNSEYSSGFVGGRSSWSWNQYFGMFTFVPSNGIYQSPFGSPFYSPATIRFVYIPRMTTNMMIGAPAPPPLIPGSISPMAPPAFDHPSPGPGSLNIPSRAPVAPGGMVSPRMMGGRGR
ncbi:MAG: hypothetical protein ABL967_16070 [Bryobacteraceae bacterium]